VFLIRFFISFALFIFLSPILLAIYILVYIDDGHPIIFKQKRVGFNNKLFWIFKFRTMKHNTLDIPTHLLKKNTISYTKYGKFLRKYSLDELPQLINILKNDISFIGPRPSLYNQKDLIQKRTKENIHLILPGITGWAQVNGRDELSVNEKVKLDSYYLKNKSVFLNCKILVLTIYKVVRSEDVSI
jgi:O-antigen biosynthesis protein WbqP